MVKESQRYGAKWSKKWAQENAVKRILAELPAILASYAHPVDKQLFPTWTGFLEEFYNQGGIIEGIPPSESTTSLTVDVFIQPDGGINVLSSGDQICSVPYKVWGVSIPQSSVPTHQLAEAVRGVATSCRARGIIGYLSIDFVTFIDPYSVSEKLHIIIMMKVVVFSSSQLQLEVPTEVEEKRTLLFSSFTDSTEKCLFKLHVFHNTVLLN